jgi:hypothetical protein
MLSCKQACRGVHLVTAPQRQRSCVHTPARVGSQLYGRKTEISNQKSAISNRQTASLSSPRLTAPAVRGLCRPLLWGPACAGSAASPPGDLALDFACPASAYRPAVRRPSTLDARPSTQPNSLTALSVLDGKLLPSPRLSTFDSAGNPIMTKRP